MTEHPGPDLLRELQTGAIRAALAPEADATLLVVGISGGLDSVCLVHALRQLAGPWRLQLHLAHLDHALRPDSADDAAFVARLAAAWALPCTVKRLPESYWTHTPDGVEATARQARYAFLGETAINVTPPGKVPRVVVAHHADDQAETLLLHLVRGSGLRGMAGMRMISQLPVNELPVLLIRPLLAISHQTILAYAQANQLSWREDSTNQRVDLVRNRLRHRVLPELRAINPNLAETFGRMASLLAADGERLAALDRQLLAELRLDPPSSGARVVLDWERWRSLSVSEQRGVLREALALLRSTLTEHEFGFEPIERLRLALLERIESGGPHPLGAGLAWSTSGASAEQPARASLHSTDRLPFAPDHPYLDEDWRRQTGQLALPASGQLDLPNGWRLQLRPADADRASLGRIPTWQARLDRDQINRLILTTPQPGWRIAPLGMGGRHKMLGDLFTDCKIPVALRAGWPVIVDQPTNTVLWVCGLAMAETAKINAETRQVVELSWHPVDSP